MQLGPTEPRVWMATARLLTRTGRGDLAVEWWRRIASAKELSREDRRDFATAALTANDIGTAGDQIAFLMADAKAVQAEDLLLAGQYAAANGQLSEARRLAEKVANDPAAKPRQVVAAAAILYRNADSDPTERKAAGERLAQIARGTPSVASLNALVILSEQYLASPNQPATQRPVSAEELANRLEQHPRALPRQKLLALEIRFHENPSREEDLVRQAILSFGRGDDDTVAALCEWLYQHRRFEAILRVLPMEKAARSRELLMERLDSLAQLGRFEELKQVLLAENPALDRSLQHGLLAVVRAKLGETSASENEWSRAVAEAREARTLMTLGSYAEKNAAPDVADAAYARALSRQPDLRAGYLNRLRLARQAEATSRAHQIVSEIVKRWPNDRQNRVNEIFLRLLEDSSPENGVIAEKELIPLLATNPADAMTRRTMALALLREGRGAAALEVLPQPQPGDPPSAVLAAAWAANGWNDKAREEAHRLTTEKLFPEERALIANIRP